MNGDDFADVGVAVLALMDSIQETATHNMEAIVSTHMQTVQMVMLELEDAFPDVIDADSALTRVLIMLEMGLCVGLAVAVFLAFAMGAWGIPVAVAAALGVHILSGLWADPDRDWSLQSGAPAEGSVLGIPLNF